MGKKLALIIWLSVLINVIVAQNYTPKENILLNCGDTDKQSTDADGRKWNSDVGSKFLSSSKETSVAEADTQAPDVAEVPFMSARLFRANFTYSIAVAPGRKFVRLYFYPNTYAGLNSTNAIFSVTAGPITLLSNFSAAQTTQALNFDYLIKEYSINVEGDTLSLTFSPSSNYTNSFAFVNGIEVVSMPYIYEDDDGTAVVGGGAPFTIDNTTALEGLYRLNVGGNYIPPTKDTGLFRSWSDDTPYIFGAATGTTNVADVNVTFTNSTPSFTAPLDVYSTARFMTMNNSVNLNFNLTWLFTVDTGFSYLVRLHFCEIFANISKTNQFVFNIYLNNQTAYPGYDIIALATSNGIPNVQDFVVFLPDSKEPQQDLWLALHPDTSGTPKPNYYNSFLNGVEIFKMSTPTGSLAGQNPIPAPIPDFIESPSGSSHSTSHTAAIGGGIAGAVGLVFLVALLACFISRRRRYGKVSNPSDGPSGWLPLSLYGNSHTSGSAKTTTTGSYTSSLPSNLCRHFSFAEIKSATKNFDESRVLGVGGFGKVYRGEIDGGSMKVAIKRGNPLSEQGIHEFQTEIEMLSKLRHRHLVSLLGYCEENGEMILVYDYMAFGTLREHLYKTKNPPLPWKQRLEISIGPSLDHTHVSTVVKGSFGYLDPEYFRRQQLTDKSDVYSFGVVLFELLCARPALNPSLPKEQVSLAEWAVYCYKKGILDQITDPYLKGKIAPECFKKFAETAMKCVSDQSIDRPSMGDVLWNLEFALQLQESAEESGAIGGIEFVEGKYDVECGKKDPDESRTFDGTVTDSRSTMSIGGRSLASEDSDGLTPSAVFSQIMNPKGR
ncbi:hypothetical protein SOVF_089720 [Spinacia oleracea]|nr:hypothetical protein SOVF_089720 [Spinacia oleracea]